MGRAEQAASLLPHVKRLAEEHGPALKRALTLLLEGALVGPAADRLPKAFTNQHEDVRSAFYAAFDAALQMAVGTSPTSAIPTSQAHPEEAAPHRPSATAQTNSSRPTANQPSSTPRPATCSATAGTPYACHYLPGLGQGAKDMGLTALAGNPMTAPFYIAIKPKGWLEPPPRSSSQRSRWAQAPAQAQPPAWPPPYAAPPKPKPQSPPRPSKKPPPKPPKPPN
jgi:hypothetical protein